MKGPLPAITRSVPVLVKDLLLLDGGWTTKSPADGNKSLSLPKSICSQEVVSSCLGKDLSAWRRSTISGTDYSGRDHITVKYCFWNTRLFKKHSYRSQYEDMSRYIKRPLPAIARSVPVLVKDHNMKI